ncbi:MAG: hypothetical protein JWP08_241 [Bryobacterales bacterium]|nr:hypothetical protein [Bryobacterales bacterium]
MDEQHSDVPDFPTVDAFDIFLDNEQLWRSTEIEALRRHLQGSGDPAWSETLARAGITMLYAHWEGFVKQAAESYLAYISERIRRNAIAIGTLSDHVRALIVYKRYTKPSEGERPIPRFLRVTKESLAEDPTAVVELSYHKLVETEANLNFAVFRSIGATIGLDTTKIDILVKSFDANIVAFRMTLAHGGRIDPVEVEAFHRYSARLLEAINEFKYILLDAALDEAFKAS